MEWNEISHSNMEWKKYPNLWLLLEEETTPVDDSGNIAFFQDGNFGGTSSYRDSEAESLYGNGRTECVNEQHHVLQIIPK